MSLQDKLLDRQNCGYLKNNGIKGNIAMISNQCPIMKNSNFQVLKKMKNKTKHQQNFCLFKSLNAELRSVNLMGKCELRCCLVWACTMCRNSLCPLLVVGSSVPQKGPIHCWLVLFVRKFCLVLSWNLPIWSWSALWFCPSNIEDQQSSLPPLRLFVSS